MMDRRWKRRAAALLAALALTIPAHAAQIEADGQTLNAKDAWVEEGTSYVTLRAFSARTGRSLTWTGEKARLAGTGLELEAAPGALYVTANGRALYVPGGVRVEDGVTILPLSVLANAAGAELTWDGENAAARLKLDGAVPPQADYDQTDLYWLSRIISAESRGEPLLGQIAVGNVVLNRVASGQFPNTVKEVVFDRKYGVQFEPVSNGTIYDQPTDSAVLAAKLCLEGAAPVGDSLYFYAPALSAGTWISTSRAYYGTIGCHKFYE